MRFSLEPTRILDFDWECKPGFWIGGDYVTKIVTACASMFVGEETEPVVDVAVRVGVAGERDRIRMLKRFVKRYNEADVVTGHYIRAFDLPLVNSALIRLGLEPLGNKMTHDTKLDMVKRSGLSTSQENLGALFELNHPKVQMNEPLWVSSIHGQKKALEGLVDRVAGDVLQHVELRAEMMRRGLLGPPRRWTGSSSGTVTRYHA
jgi:hypothetical protein